MASAVETAPLTIEEFLERHEASELLRFSTAGSVDDGKSTLIGRLLYDSKSVYEDQLHSVAQSRINRSSGPIDFSLLTDGLRAEREQGITIDVAYRYFSTPRRKFIIADTPGHEQYTRNMATGASTAQLAVILLDARKGVLPQSRRHTYISWLLGIPHLAVAVNKMDLTDFSRSVFERIREEYLEFANRLGFESIVVIPMSALEGDNVVTRSPRTEWYEGPSLLEHLETVPVSVGAGKGDLRFPVQYVVRPNLDFRGFAGQVASGLLHTGEQVMALPSGRTSRVKSITTYDGDLRTAFAPQSVCVTLTDEIDLSRGDILVDPHRPPHVSRRLTAALVWMNEQPLEVRRPYLLKHTSRQITASVVRVRHRVDVDSLAEEPAERLDLNEIGVVEIESTQPLYYDAYRVNRVTGAFILIDPLSNATLAAGMIAEPESADARTAHIDVRTGRVAPAERIARNGHLAVTVWLRARTSLAWLVERRLFERGCQVQALADDVESHLLPELARLLNTAGVIAICSDASGQPPAGSIWFEPGVLPVDDIEAAAQIVEELDRRGVFLPPDFSSGEGI